MNAEKLLKLADILDAAHAAGRQYDQRCFYYRGAPSCAWGYWADAHPGRFRIEDSEAWDPRRALWDAAKEFDISEDDAFELFGYWGCGRAITAEDAARYIREFVERNRSG